MKRRKQPKQIPPVYPEPEPIHLPPRKIVSIDEATRTITLEGPTPPELIKLHEMIEKRFNLPERLSHYLKCSLQITLPHYGTRPAYVSQTDWESHESRIRRLVELPENAPAEAKDSLRCAKIIQQITDRLVAEDDWSDRMDEVICLAIDLGKLLQRVSVQIELGAQVAAGKVVEKARQSGAKKVAESAESRSAKAEKEFRRRLAQVKGQPRMKTAILKAMAKVRDPDGRPVYGSYSTLKRYSKDWK
jgi:hypothetical protein